jgi:MFS family permease
MLAFGAAAFANSLWLFLGIFMLTGFCRDSTNVAGGTLMTELPPAGRRLKYMALGSAVLAPGMIMAPLLGSVAWSLGGGRYVYPAALALLLLGVSLYLAMKIKDPRRANQWDCQENCP